MLISLIFSLLFLRSEGARRGKGDTEEVLTNISVQNFTFYKSHSCPRLNLSFIASLSGRYNQLLCTV